MRPLSKSTQWSLIIIAVLWIGLILFLRMLNRPADTRTGVSWPGDPLAQRGTRWDPELIRQTAAAGRAAFTIPRRPAAVLRPDAAGLAITAPGTIAAGGGTILDPARAVRTYPADGSRWREEGPCLRWSFQGLDLAADRDFGGIEVHVADHRTDEHAFHISFLSQTATIPLVPGQSMKYLILPDMAASPDNAAVFDKNTLEIVFPDIERPEDIELLGVAVVSKTAAYRQAPCGSACETLNQETRPVLYQWTNGEAAWDVTVPGGSPLLKLGVGVLPGSPPATFTVSIASRGRTEAVFSRTVDAADVWEDCRIDLAGFTERSVRILFKTASAAPAIALWSSPRIVQAGRRGNLVCLYLVDALRPDFCEGLGTFRGRPNSTPAMLRLAEGGARFTNALANAPLTKYSMPALFSGLYPLHTGIMTYQRVPDEILTLAEAFQQNGFVTASFLFNGNAGRLRGLHQGFDHLFTMGRLSREARQLSAGNPRENPHIYTEHPTLTSGGMINEFLFDFIRAHQDEDVFLFLHLMDTHMPYFPDEDLLDGFRQELERAGYPAPAGRAELLSALRAWDRLPPDRRFPESALLELYRACAQTADRHLQRFLDFLEAEGLVERTTLVFTADHGEHLNEHPDIRLFSHMHPMLLEVLRVPLIVYAPGRVPRGRTVSDPVQLADVMPTLLDLAGISIDPARFDGLSLAALMAGSRPELFAERPIISQSHPYWSVLLHTIHSPDITRQGDIRIFDIENDPGEHVPLQGAAAQKDLESLVAALGMVPVREVPGTATIITEQETLDQLKQLGYIQ